VVENFSQTLLKLPKHDLDFWVYASTSWGIGLCVGENWVAWKLLDGWNMCGQDIGWAEVTAIKLAMMWLTQSGWHDSCLKIHFNNASVIVSFWKGHSHNPAHSESLCRITLSLATPNLSSIQTYIQSTINKVNSLSCGVVGADMLHIEPCVITP